MSPRLWKPSGPVPAGASPSVRQGPPASSVSGSALTSACRYRELALAVPRCSPPDGVPAPRTLCQAVLALRLAVAGGSAAPLLPCAAGWALGSRGCWQGRVLCARQPCAALRPSVLCCSVPIGAVLLCTHQPSAALRPSSLRCSAPIGAVLLCAHHPCAALCLLSALCHGPVLLPQFAWSSIRPSRGLPCPRPECCQAAGGSRGQLGRDKPLYGF